MSSRKKSKKYYMPKSRSQKKASPLRWLLTGILIGLIVPGIFYLKSSSNQKTERKTQSDIQLSQIQHTLTLPPKKTKTLLARHPIKIEKDEAKFEFYNMLSSQEGAAKEPESTFTNRRYSVALASVDSFEQADQLKAQLSLLGIDKISVKKKLKAGKLVYCVIAGPYSREAAYQTQQQLKDNSIQSVMTVNEE